MIASIYDNLIENFSDFTKFITKPSQIEYEQLKSKINFPIYNNNDFNIAL